MNKKIAITYKQGPFENARAALTSLDLRDIKGKSVLIKPNTGRVIQKEHYGINTHPEAIAGVIEALQAAGAKRIAIGESPIVGVSVIKAFESGGVAEVAAHYGIELLDLDASRPLTKPIPDGRLLTETTICSAIEEFDLILSLPVAKCHMHTGVTLGIKNMKGCLYKYEKVRYHQLEYAPDREFPEKTLDTAISDLARILLPDITVIDGYIGMEGLGPSGGEPRLSDFAVASRHPLGADLYGCLMMGIDPGEIDYLQIIAAHRIWSADPADYEVIAPATAVYQDHIVVYKRPPDKLSVEYPDIVLYDKESCSACLSTVMLFLKRFHTDMSAYLFDDGKLYIAIGKGLNPEEMHPETLMVGNCAHKCRLGGKFVPGCPPVPTRIYKEITGSEPAENEPEVN